MILNFTKMHGAGNDFIVVDAIRQNVAHFTRDDWRRLADRHFGIGADQILLIEKPSIAGVDFKYSIYNQDGNRVENCGNGARCFVKYVRDKGLTEQHEIKVQIDTGTMVLTMNADESVMVNMGVPKCEAQDLPALVDGLVHKKQGGATLYAIDVNGRETWLSLVSMGNPHAVQIVADVETAPVLQDGAALENHVIFPHKANIGFMQIHDEHHIALRVFERGAGETLACGTGACAAVVVGILRGVLTSPVRVDVRGGVLQIEWAGAGHDVLMSGPAATVFEGSVQLGN